MLYGKSCHIFWDLEVFAVQQDGLTSRLIATPWIRNCSGTPHAVKFFHPDYVRPWRLPGVFNSLQVGQIHSCWYDGEWWGSTPPRGGGCGNSKTSIYQSFLSFPLETLACSLISRVQHTLSSRSLPLTQWAFLEQKMQIWVKPSTHLSYTIKTPVLFEEAARNDIISLGDESKRECTNPVYNLAPVAAWSIFNDINLRNHRILHGVNRRTSRTAKLMFPLSETFIQMRFKDWASRQPRTTVSMPALQISLFKK